MDRREDLSPGLWDRLRAQPDRAPELIALEAAERLAPSAERWVRDNAARFDPPLLAKRAVKRHVSLARREGGAMGLAGAWGIVPDLAALAWIQSRMVFHVGASFGFDPRHPMRPAELLALQGIYETPQAAREALDGVGRHMAIAYAEGRMRSDTTLRNRLVKMVGGKVASKAAGKVIPGIASPIMAFQNGNAVAELGDRALRFYGGQEGLT